MKKYKVIGKTGYSFDDKILGKVYDGTDLGNHCIELIIPGVGAGVWNFTSWNVAEVSSEEVVKKTKKSPPVLKQRKLHISYADGSKYLIKGCISFVVNTKTSEINISYKKIKDDIEYRINFTLPFNFVDSVYLDTPDHKVNYLFDSNKLLSINSIPKKAQVFQH